MRSWVVLVGIAAMSIMAMSSQAALPADDAARRVGETAGFLDLPTPLRLELLDDSGDPEASDGSDSSGGAYLAQAAARVSAPLHVVGQSLLTLGLQILAALFIGLQASAETAAAAAQVVADSPAESAAIASTTLLLAACFGGLCIGWQRYGSLGAIPLFTRIAKSELLEHRLRNEIFELIKSNPGINVSEISRRLDVAWGTTTHHLQKLRAERYVSIRLVANQKCYFPNGGTYTAQEMDVLSATKHPTARRIAEYVVQSGSCTHGQIVRELGVVPALVSFHVQKLVTAGLVERRRDGRRTIFTRLATDLNPQPRPTAHF